MPSPLNIVNMSLASGGHRTKGDVKFHDDRSVYSSCTLGGVGSTSHSTCAMSSCQSSLDPMFDDANLSPFDVLLYPPHNPFSDPEDQLLQFASETHPGNVRFLVLLDLHRPFYDAAVRDNDQALVDRVCDAVVDQIVNGCVPSGAFKEWTVDEQNEDEFGDLGDDAGLYGQDGSWDDLGSGGAARMLVLRGLRNAPVTSEFDIVPQGDKRRTSLMNDAAADAFSRCHDTDEEWTSPSTLTSKGKDRKDKHAKRSFIKMIFGKKSSKKAADNTDPTLPHIEDIAAGTSTNLKGSEKNSSSSFVAGQKRSRRDISASCSESIRAYAIESRRGHPSGQFTSFDESIPKSAVTKSDVLLSDNVVATDTVPEGSSKKKRSQEDEQALGLSVANKNRPGNRRLMSLIDMYKPSYDAVKPEPAKRASIVAEIAATMYRGTSTAEPGRYLKEEPQTGMYREVGCVRVISSIEHLLDIANPKE
mmetsp:Transcript_34542/g.74913  ORF Transcript_34542/g.74913 Transcript_34542/m.74913 type:complete len:474 (+) Transcript_34542:409-1830(+)